MKRKSGDTADFISQSKGDDLDMEYDIYQDVKGKKLLILAGAPQHCKLVRAAKDMGVYTVVTDYLPDSPAKKHSDQVYQIDIKNIDGIIRLCKKEHIDGVISSHIDPCQQPYYQICQQLRLPCYGTSEQFQKMTDKRMFKEMCKKNGVDIVPEYTENGIKNETIAYPVFVKPVDSRGLRGQSVCCQRAELPMAKERENETDFIYFNSVGMSYVDISLALWMYKKAIAAGKGTLITMKNKSMFDID